MPRAVPGALFYISVTDVLPRQVILKWTPEGNKKVLGIYGEIQVQEEGGGQAAWWARRGRKENES